MNKKSRKWIALGTLAALTTGTLGAASITPAQAQHRSFVRRHPFVTAAGAALVYHHYHKKHLRQQRLRRRA